MAKLGLYVYCITPAETKTLGETPERKSYGNIGFDGNEVYTVYCRGMNAVVSDSPIKEYEMTDENTEKHRDVALEVMKTKTVLPVAFGMVFESEKTLRTVMNGARKALQAALQTVQDKVELGVKLVFPLEALQSFKDWGGGKSREEYVKEVESDMMETLGKIAAEKKKLRLFSERLAFNAAFLVEKSRVDEFSEVLGKLDDKYESLKTQYSGPWPAYNFVDIKIMSKEKRRRGI